MPKSTFFWQNLSALCPTEEKTTFSGLLDFGLFPASGQVTLASFSSGMRKFIARWCRGGGVSLHIFDISGDVHSFGSAHAAHLLRESIRSSRLAGIDSCFLPWMPRQRVHLTKLQSGGLKGQLCPRATNSASYVRAARPGNKEASNWFSVGVSHGREVRCSSSFLFGVRIVLGDDAVHAALW